MWLLLSVLWVVACVPGQRPDSSTSSSSSSGSGGGGGGDPGPCGVDCSKFKTLPCTVAVCNTGQVVGPLNTCVVVPADDGTACDDGQFCTINDLCVSGICIGGSQNDCGIPSDPCSAVICYEDSKSCDVTPDDDGTACTPTDLCQTNGTCMIGECVGEPKDCKFSPLNECNTVACDPGTGKCVGTPDPTKDDSSCVLTGPLCSVNKTCLAGECGGGAPKDCSALDVECQVGACDDMTGLCGPTNAPIGTACRDGVPECHVGACDVKGTCLATTGPDGNACNDHDSCTESDTCASGVCSGSPVAGCTLYLSEGFETCPDGWTLGGDWQCGTPANVGPPAAHTGKNVIATKLTTNYSVNQTFAACVANSPPIDLTLATNPALSFWVWDYTEGSTFDGWNLKASIDGGQTFTEVMTVNPGYDLMIATPPQPAWGGDHSAEGWQNYTADLSAYKGHSVILQFGFRSDGATVYPGVYLDDVVVSEPVELPLYISTTSLPDAYAGTLYSVQLKKTGGTGGSQWTIVGGMNKDWLNLNVSTGLLTGTPSQQETGAVSVTVQVAEPSLPSNFAQQTYTFNVNPDAYYTSFEGTCPDGWALTGDWQCGVPMNVGPPTAYDGTQCLATQIGANYNNLDAWATNTATSPLIDLTGMATPTLTFRMWLDTEGSTYDGADLQISTDGGMTYSVVNSVMPPYGLTIAGKRAWGGHQALLGWQPVQVDLTAYVGQFVYLRFAFQSDSSNIFAGVYIDDFLVE